MKFFRNLYVPVTVITVGGLLTTMLALWRWSGFGDGWALTAVVFCVAGCTGVIWLCWRLFKQSGEITSLSMRLVEKGTVHFKAGGGALISELKEALKNHIDSNISHIADLEKQVKDLEVQNQLSQNQRVNTEAIIYSIRDAVVVIDELDRLLMANEAAGGLFDFEYKDSKYSSIEELLGTGDNARTFINVLRQSRDGKVRATRREIEFAVDDIAKTFDCIFSCIYDENKRVCGVVAVLHDITREKEVSQMKNDFISHVSHELKTPLASITAYAEMLVDGEADEPKTRKEFYSVIQNQAQRLNRLIEDILNVSRIESGLIKVNKELISLTILLKEQFQVIKGYANDKDISLTFSGGGQKAIVCDQVYADRDMISQVVVNLLSNAVKYTPAGGSVKIESEIVIDENSEETVRVSVTDTGIGIPQDEIEYVFDKFYRVRAKKNQNQAKGTGLGLNLVKQIVQKVHNGRVFVHSKVGQGSTFGFELALATRQKVEVT